MTTFLRLFKTYSPIVLRLWILYLCCFETEKNWAMVKRAVLQPQWRNKWYAQKTFLDLPLMLQFYTLNTSKNQASSHATSRVEEVLAKRTWTKSSDVEVLPWSTSNQVFMIFTFVFSKLSEWIIRFSYIRYKLEICHDRHDGRSCKNISSCVIFSRKQRFSLKVCVEIWNLVNYLVSLKTHFLRNYWKFTFSFQNDLNWNAVLSFAKIVTIFAFLVCKIVCRKNLVV